MASRGADRYDKTETALRATRKTPFSAFWGWNPPRRARCILRPYVAVPSGGVWPNCLGGPVGMGGSNDATVAANSCETLLLES